MASGISKAIQGRTIEDVLELYKLRAVGAFGIVQGGQMLMSYSGNDTDEGEQLLKQTLELLYESCETSVYTLYSYDIDELNGKKINSKTPYNNSINFRFHDVNFPTGQPRALQSGLVIRSQGTDNSELLNEMKAMRLELEALKAEKNEDSESSLGFIGELIAHPAIEPIIPALVNRLLDWVEGGNKNDPGGNVRDINQPTSRVKISGIEGSEVKEGVDYMTIQVDELTYNSLQVLNTKVDDLPLLLGKLAKLSQTQPVRFAVYVGMLKTFKL